MNPAIIRVVPPIHGAIPHETWALVLLLIPLAMSGLLCLVLFVDWLLDVRDWFRNRRATRS
jgi:hypothetical protein